MPDADVAAHATHRNRSIRLAVLTSFLSKFGTILLQLISIPLAVRVLGREEFGLYTTVNLTLSVLMLLQVGVGPALAHGLSQARAAGDETRQKELGSTAFFLMGGLALLVGSVAGSLLLALPMSAIYGDDFSGNEPALRAALWVGLALFLMMFVLGLTERIREGHLEVAVNNVWGAIGNVLAAVVVASCIWFVPEVWFVVLAVHGTMVLMKIGNTIALWRAHPLMVPSARAFRGEVARHLFTDGIAFSACTLVAGLVEYSVCGWMLGRTDGPSAVALYGVFITLTTMQLGFVIMFSAPTWPAVAEALARGDKTWARNAARKLYLYGAAFALCSSLGLLVLGPWGLRIWLGEEFAGISRGTLACYTAYFIAHVWRHLGHSMMIGTGQVTRLARIQFFESGLVALGAWIALKFGSMEIMLLAMAVIITAITGWFLPHRVAAVLR
jgi:O-antigen/teichoic acid export membrane protein